MPETVYGKTGSGAPVMHRMRCVRCGNWTKVDPWDLYAPDICDGCWRKSMEALDVSADRFAAFNGRHEQNRAHHPTAKWVASIWKIHPDFQPIEGAEVPF